MLAILTAEAWADRYAPMLKRHPAFAQLPARGTRESAYWHRALVLAASALWQTGGKVRVYPESGKLIFEGQRAEDVAVGKTYKQKITPLQAARHPVVSAIFPDWFVRGMVQAAK